MGRSVEIERSSASASHEWRVERFLELGFTVVDAQLLAVAQDETTVRDRHGAPRRWCSPLHWMKVAKTLKAGATHEQALRTFA